MAFVKVDSARNLRSGEKIGFQAGENDILIANLNGKHYAIGNICTHTGCRLSDGMIKAESIECPCHGSVFDIKTGKALKGPAKKPEKKFKVKVESGQVFVEL